MARLSSRARQARRVARKFSIGDTVRYQHPDFGECTGVVRALVGRKGKLSVDEHGGGRELWPAARCEVVS